MLHVARILPVSNPVSHKHSCGLVCLSVLSFSFLSFFFKPRPVCAGPWALLGLLALSSLADSAVIQMLGFGSSRKFSFSSPLSLVCVFFFFCLYVSQKLSVLERRRVLRVLFGNRYWASINKTRLELYLSASVYVRAIKGNLTGKTPFECNEFHLPTSAVKQDCFPPDLVQL